VTHSRKGSSVGGGRKKKGEDGPIGMDYDNIEWIRGRGGPHLGRGPGIIGEALAIRVSEELGGCGNSGR